MYSIVFQITQECPFSCQTCLRFFDPQSRPLTQNRQNDLVLNLSKNNVRRIAVTGGEPTLLGRDLISFLTRCNQLHIHTSLCSTGYSIEGSFLSALEECLDQLILSVPTLEMDGFCKHYNSGHAQRLFHQVSNLLHKLQQSPIITQVCTVVHKGNIDKLHKLGDKLSSISNKFHWRLDQYYPIGLTERFQNTYDITDSEFENTVFNLKNKFSGIFSSITPLSVKSRIKTSEYLISHDGFFVSSSNNVHISSRINATYAPLPEDFKNLRPWSYHESNCRNWGWYK